MNIMSILIKIKNSLVENDFDKRSELKGTFCDKIIIVNINIPVNAHDIFLVFLSPINAPTTNKINPDIIRKISAKKGTEKYGILETN